MNKIFSIILIIVFLITAFLVAGPLLEKGYFPMHDDTQPTRIFLMKSAILDGQFPVRWVEMLGYGYGYPLFNFYAPFPYYVGAIISFLGFDVIESSKIVFALVTAGSFITMYLFLKRWGSGIGPVIGASLYTLFPYHAVNTYVRGALSEQFGYLFVPLVLLFYSKISDNSKKLSYISSALGGISYSLLIISHNLSALILGILLIPVVIFDLMLAKNKKNFLIKLTIFSLVAFSFSAFYTIPMIFESGYTNVTSQVGGGADYKNHFVCISQFWSSVWGYGGSAPGCVDGMSFRLGKTNIVFSLVSLCVGVFMIIQRKKFEFRPFLLGGYFIVASLFFMLPISKVVWNSFEGFGFIQYPWRFLTIMGIGMSVIVGMIAEDIAKFFDKKYASIILLFFIFFLTVFNNAKLFRPQEQLNKNLEYYVSDSSVRYTVSKISDEYMPKNFEKPKRESDVPIGYFSGEEGDLTFRTIRSSSDHIQASIIALQEKEILLNIAPFPSWYMYLDDRKMPFKNTNRGISAQVPKGQYELELRFQSTFPQKAGNVITLFSIFTLIAVIITKRFYGKKTS